jgi:hypothetical protein
VGITLAHGGHQRIRCIEQYLPGSFLEISNSIISPWRHKPFYKNNVSLFVDSHRAYKEKVKNKKKGYVTENESLLFEMPERNRN